MGSYVSFFGFNLVGSKRREGNDLWTLRNLHTYSVIMHGIPRPTIAFSCSLKSECCYVN